MTRRFLVSGRVQGVGFRYFVYEAARFEQLAGWVKNRRDGHVEVLAEGPEAAMRRFETQLRNGPPRSRVDAVEVSDAPDAGLTGFHIHED